jgi:hypothetical protein
MRRSWSRGDAACVSSNAGGDPAKIGGGLHARIADDAAAHPSGCLARSHPVASATMGTSATCAATRVVLLPHCHRVVEYAVERGAAAERRGSIA